MRALLPLLVGLRLALGLPGAQPTPEPGPGSPQANDALPEPSTALADPTPAATPAHAPAVVPRADPTAIWVGINKDGSPTATVTPHQTVENGQLTLADAPPYELTGTVFTSLDQMRKTTSTGSRRPAPTGKGKTGAVAKCFKDEGEESPICEPIHNDENAMIIGKTYYITWDPKFFKDELAAAKDPIQISLEAHRLGEGSAELGDKRWQTKDNIPSRYGVFGWKPPKNVLHGREPANVTLVLRTHYKDSDDEDAPLASTEYVGPTVRIENKPAAPNAPPENQELYIALPIISVAVLLVVLGVFLYNRNIRRIGLGNVMSRQRHGHGLRKSRKKLFGKGTRMGARSEEMANMLDDFDGRDSGEALPVLREELERSEQEWNKRRF